MKRITFFPLTHHYFKYAGLMASLLGLGLALFHDTRFELLLYTGMLIMVFSRERNETELTERIRNEVFKSIFGFILSLAIALYITESVSDNFVLEVTPFLFIGLPLVLYLLLYYIILFFKIEVDSSMELVRQMKNHRRAYMVWFLVILVIMSVWVLRMANVL